MKKLLGTLAIVILATRLLAQSNAPVRLALIAETGEASTAADVLTAQLSGNPKVQLLERNEIEKVYREQELSAANKDYLKLGQILGADGLLLLETAKEGTNQFLQARLVTVKPGVVLASLRFSWPLADPAHWAAGFANHLNPLMPKLTVLARDAVPISIVNLRSAVQSEESRELERQLTLLTIERLSRERQLFVLERQRMQLLSEEKELKGLDDSSFWNGSYLLEGTIDRNGYSKEMMTMSIRLIPPKGGTVQQIELSGSRANPGGAFNELAKRVVEALKLGQSAAPWNAADEAEQFFSEAKWAYRWGLLTQAQAASESAWALGKHTKELAALRIRAYADGVWPIYDWSGNIQIPAVPDEAKLPSIIRALSLFCHDAQLMFPDQSSVDEEWYMDGIRIFRESVAMLDGFYLAAELRAGNEDQLAELRRLTRQTLSLLERMRPNVIQQRRSFSVNISKLKMYDLVKWEEGGVFFDRPEDALPLFRDMLEQGYAPVEPPRIVGWTWEDRKRVPQVSRRFVDELCASTNPAAKIGGLCLALVRTPYYPETVFHAREQDLVTALWDYRDWIFSGADHASFITQTESILRNKYGDSDVYVYFGREPFAGIRQRLRKDYLTTQTNFDAQVFETLFSPSFPTISPDEARELIPLIEQFAQKNQAKPNMAAEIRSRTRFIKSRTGMATVIPQTNAAAPALPAGKSMLARFVRWNLKSLDADPSRRPELQNLMVRNRKLWSLVCYLRPSETLALDSPPVAFVSADPDTGASEAIPFPGKLGRPDGFEVAGDSLYVSVQNHLERYRFRERTWDRIPVPMESGAQVFNLNGRLYLATSDSLLEVTPDSGAVQVLVSARRTPPANGMDSVWQSGSRLYRRGETTLGVIITNHFFSFETESRRWKEYPFPAGRSRCLFVPFFSDAGVQVLLTGGVKKRHVVGFWNDAAVTESLLEHNSQNGPFPDPKLDQALGPSRWDWPPGFELEASHILADGKILWILNPRKVWTELFSNRNQEPVAFSDDRQATLFCFEPEFRQPLTVPVRFEKDGQPVDPFDPRLGKFPFPGLWERLSHGENNVPYWLDTPAGLLLSSPALGGHWLISKAALEARLREQRDALRRNNVSSPTPTNAATGDLKP